MKKKITLQSLAVSSFVTELDSSKKDAIKGKGGLPETMYSCLRYVSCYPTDCIPEVNS